jgi:two-component system, sensor histidine kinase and response regulator
MLSAQGYHVRVVQRAMAALQAAREEPPDLVLLDINMPEMNGYELCRQLKTDPLLKDIPVIFISALNEAMDKVEAFRMGGVDYLTKPFQLEEVQARVETHLKIRILQRRLGDQNANLERLVEKRTSELAQAYQRCRELGHLKDDFLRMISHEMRTPANGVLGIGMLLLDLCPDSQDRTLYASLFRKSSQRMRNLIEDATMIAQLEKRNWSNGTAPSLGTLLEEVRGSLPEIRILSEPLGALETFFPTGDGQLLKRALQSMILLAISFSHQKLSARLTATIREEVLHLQLNVDALPLSTEQLTEFFEIESPVRSSSFAEPLGLAPIVAHHIITTFGGTFRLVKEEGDHGYLEVILLQK